MLQVITYFLSSTGAGFGQVPGTKWSVIEIVPKHSLFPAFGDTAYLKHRGDMWRSCLPHCLFCFCSALYISDEAAHTDPVPIILLWWMLFLFEEQREVGCLHCVFLTPGCIIQRVAWNGKLISKQLVAMSNKFDEWWGKGLQQSSSRS